MATTNELLPGEISEEDYNKAQEKETPVIRYETETSPYMKWLQSQYGNRATIGSGGLGAGTISDEDYSYYQQNKDFRTPEEKENAIRQNMIGQYQGLIDAINQGFMSQIRTEEKAGEERSGQTRAISARSGLLTSPMGGAMEEKTKELTKGNIASIEAQRTAKIAEIFTNIDQRVEQKLQSDKELQFKKTQDYMAGMKELDTVKKQQKADTLKDVAEMALSGVSYDKLDKTDAKNIQDLLGMSDFQLEQYWNANLPKNQQIDYQTSWRGNNLVMYGQDAQGNLVTKTYTAEDLGIPEEVKGEEIELFTDKVSGRTFWYKPSELETLGEGAFHSTGLYGAEPYSGGGGGVKPVFADIATTVWNTAEIPSDRFTTAGVLSKTYQGKLVEVGISSENIKVIWDWLVGGLSLDQIRTKIIARLKKGNSDANDEEIKSAAYGMLDTFIQALQRKEDKDTEMTDEELKAFLKGE